MDMAQQQMTLFKAVNAVERMCIVPLLGMVCGIMLTRSAKYLFINLLSLISVLKGSLFQYISASKAARMY
jgi:hypothetical protein